MESLFFSVFEGYIHYFNSRKRSYKCFFQGPDAYAQLTSIFNNPNWGRKFFDNDQQTFVLLFDAQAEKEANCNLFGKRYKNRLPRLTVEWKVKAKKDAKNNKTLAGYMYLNFYTRQI